MRHLLLICILSLMFVSGCDNSSDNLNHQKEAPKITDSIETITVQFGDGNNMTISNKDQVKYIIDQIRSYTFESVDKPLSVGQHFFLKLGNQQYLSTGYLTYDGTYYKVKDTDEQKVLQLNNYIINIGKEKFPSLLGG
ncbi:hypothetical protein ASG89_34470 [Paenibacillus sp. Soil766]|uniref:hypothetical protein n=1 Tax=Paenibacillus sp. Soil766 TaxID=1736404 RepID=UPI00070B92F7|nr:hypothetical protein [Paenibacillus sp. Soil766]KRE91147.1 hypothetical protein ASG89_34470 [Paenibacillus sp. Soil766]